MKDVTREEFMTFAAKYRGKPDCEEKPVHAETISAMQIVKGGELVAQAIYSKPVDLPGVKVIVTYQIKD